MSMAVMANRSLLTISPQFFLQLEDHLHTLKCPTNVYLVFFLPVLYLFWIQSVSRRLPNVHLVKILKNEAGTELPVTQCFMWMTEARLSDNLTLYLELNPLRRDNRTGSTTAFFHNFDVAAPTKFIVSKRGPFSYLCINRYQFWFYFIILTHDTSTWEIHNLTIQQLALLQKNTMFILNIYTLFPPNLTNILNHFPAFLT